MRLTPADVTFEDRRASSASSGITRAKPAFAASSATSAPWPGRSRRAPRLRIPSQQTTVRADAIPDYLGPPRFHDEVAFRVSRPGVATGVAWTETGGDVLFIEATLLPSGHHDVILTGQLGAVMQESARAAVSHIRSQALEIGVPADFLDNHDLHVHVPAGAIPKDGPSAGVTMATAIVSALKKQKVRDDVAMTGEITLSGLVLPVGGIREKALAAMRHGIKEFILPARNEPDLAELPPELKRGMHFIPVHTLAEVLRVALPRHDSRGRKMTRCAVLSCCCTPLHSCVSPRRRRDRARRRRTPARRRRRHHQRPRQADRARPRAAAVERLPVENDRQARRPHHPRNPQRRRLPEGSGVPRRAAHDEVGAASGGRDVHPARARDHAWIDGRISQRRSVLPQRVLAVLDGDVQPRPLPARRDARPAFQQAGPGEGVLRHPLAHERLDPRPRSSVFHDSRGRRRVRAAQHPRRPVHARRLARTRRRTDADRARRGGPDSHGRT